MALVNGTENADQSLFGTKDNDTINGFGGFDLIFGSGGSDVIFGGADGAVVLYGNLDSSVFANLTDRQIGSVAPRTVVKFGGGTDSLTDIYAVHGTQFSDTIYIGSNTYVFAEGGNDLIYAGSQVLIFPGSGNDTIYGDGANLAYEEGDGSRIQTSGIVAFWDSATSGVVHNDGWGNTDRFFGITGISGSAYGDYIVTNIGNDWIDGAEGNDVLYGNGGNDYILGGGGDDYMSGGEGNDSLEGGNSDDSLFGGDGDDSLSGGQGNDIIFGGSGSDWINVWGEGVDEIDGGAGQDSINYGEDLLALKNLSSDYGVAASSLSFTDVSGNVRLTLTFLQDARLQVTRLTSDGTVLGVDLLTSVETAWISIPRLDGVQEQVRIDIDAVAKTLTAQRTLRLDLIGTEGADHIIIADELAARGIAPESADVQVYVDGLGGDDLIDGTGVAAGLDLLGGTGNDTLTGGDGHDNIDGGEGSDVLYGASGDDRLIGGNGADTLDGGAGYNVVDYDWEAQAGGLLGAVVDLAAGTATDTFGSTDFLIGINEIEGMNASDVLLGNNDNNYFRTYLGQDVIDGRGGTYDQIDYRWFGGGITVDLVAGTIDANDGAFRHLVQGIEVIRGTILADSMRGDGADNVFDGLDGADVFDGGAGVDTISYHLDARYGGARGVQVNLAEGWAIDGFGKTDTFISIEWVRGTDFDDRIIGSETQNNIQTGGGNDVVSVGAGNDWISVNGTGSYQIDGGTGQDGLGYDEGLLEIFRPSSQYGVATTALTFSDLAGNVRLALSFLADGELQVTRTAADGSVVGIDQLTSIETIWLSMPRLNGLQDQVRLDIDTAAGTLTAFRILRLELFGTEDADKIIIADELAARGIALDNQDIEVYVEGLGGDDVIDGTGVVAKLQLIGGAGNDTLTGGDWNDYLSGGAGDDVIYATRDVLQRYGDYVEPGSGNDTIIGDAELFAAGDGSDLSYRDITGTGGLRFTIGAAGAGSVVSAVAGVVDDTFTFVHYFTGSSENDVFEASGAAERVTILGMAGDDLFVGSPGGDMLVVDYGYDLNVGGASGIRGNLGATDVTLGGVLLAAGRVVDGFGDVDTVMSIQGIRGTDFADIIAGSELNDEINTQAGDDIVAAGAGDDWIDVSGSGSKQIDGGTGLDSLGYAEDLVDAFRLSVDYGVAVSAVSFADANGFARLKLEFGIGGAVEATRLAADGSVLGVNRLTSIEEVWTFLPQQNGIQDRVRVEIDNFAGTLTAFRVPRVELFGTEGADQIIIAEELVAAGIPLDIRHLEVNVDALAGDDVIDGRNILARQYLLGGDGDDQLIGGDGDDELRGGGGNDHLIGGAGEDWIYFELGNDFYEGGAGFDRADYTDAPGAINANLVTGIVTDGSGGLDTLIDVERVTGSAFDDVLIGNSAEINSFSGGLGDDIIDGGDGFDYVWYGDALGPVYVDLATGIATGFEGTDTLTSIEGLGGSSFSDTLLGSDADNWFEPDYEDYLPTPSTGGVDYIDGRGGFDTVAYLRAVAGIRADLAAGTVIDGLGNVDTLVSIEEIEGSNFADVISGSARDDSLLGHDGDDTISGGDGNDFLYGGSGDDMLYGGEGDDIIDDGRGYDTINGGAGVDTFRRFYDGVDYGTVLALDLELGLTYSPTSPGDGSDFLIGIENLEVSGGYTFLLMGNGQANVLKSAGGDDTLYGMGGNDSLFAGDGNDLLSGGLGNDYLDGGAGTDTVAYTGQAGSVIASLVAGTATGAAGSDQLINVENLIGGNGNDTLTGNAGANILDGFTGTDTLIGGLGNDTYITDGLDTITEAAAAGNDTVHSSVTYTLGANLENLILTGTLAINGTGNTLNNEITGNAAANTLNGGEGNDTLNGGTGIDRLFGGLGDDTYITDGGDVIGEALGAGTDTVRSSATITLAANIENLILTGAAAINGTGNGLDNTVSGNAAANTLNGGTGIDRLFGGLGDDTYITDGGDVIGEAVNAGTDTVRSSATITLSANLENLILTGTVAINGTGNSLDNTVSGNAAANTLNGGTGTDRLFGGLGDDIYITDGGDEIVEAVNAGIDTVRSFATITLSANLENLVLTGTAAINGTGNGLDNTISGNAAANTLNGGTGIDRLFGGLGDDTYITDGGDVIGEAVNAGSDTVRSSATITLGANLENLILTGTAAINGTGNGLDNTISGNAAANTLNGGTGLDTITGGLGKDVLAGGVGADTFVFNTISDSTTVLATWDVITDFTRGQDKIDLRNIDAFASAGANDAFIWKGTDAFSDVTAGEVRYQQFDNAGTADDYTAVFLDNDADATVEMAIRLNGLHSLEASDFLL